MAGVARGGRPPGGDPVGGGARPPHRKGPLHRHGLLAHVGHRRGRDARRHARRGAHHGRRGPPVPGGHPARGPRRGTGGPGHRVLRGLPPGRRGADRQVPALHSPGLAGGLPAPAPPRRTALHRGRQGRDRGDRESGRGAGPHGRRRGVRVGERLPGRVQRHHRPAHDPPARRGPRARGAVARADTPGAQRGGGIALGAVRAIWCILHHVRTPVMIVRLGVWRNEGSRAPS